MPGRPTFKATDGSPASRHQQQAISDLQDAVHVGLFSYVARRGLSFVTWSTFRRRARVVWMSTTLDRAILVCESIDRRAQEQLAESAPKPRSLPQQRMNSGTSPQSSGYDDVDWYVRRPSNRVPSVRVQLAKTFTRNRYRSTESFGYAENLPSTQNYKEDA